MASIETSHYLSELWNLHSSRGDRASLLQYLEEFVGIFAELVDRSYYRKDKANLNHVNCVTVKQDGSVVLDHLPNHLLQLIHTQLMALQDQCSRFKLADVRVATYLVQALIIICRTNNQTLINLSSNLIGHIIPIASHVISMLKECNSGNERDIKTMEHFLHESLYFIECLYDPLFTWRKKVDGTKCLAAPGNVPLLNVEVIPFFYETLQIHTHQVSGELQRELLSMFGAILYGFQRNALLAISSTTLEILTKYLSQYMGLDRDDMTSFSSQQSSRENDDKSTTLVLHLFVKMVHTLHNASPDQCQLDVKTVLGKYFSLLSQASVNPDMQLQMIGFIPDFLHTNDRPALQTMLLQHGCMDHLKNVLINFKAKSDSHDETADKFAIHFVNIVNCLVAGSMNAKDHFSKILSTSFLLDHLQVMCIPSKEVLIALLKMVVEVDDVLQYPEPIKNIFIILMLFDWLPNIEQVEQQVWLSSVLTEVFTSCTTNKILSCHCKIITKVIGCLINHSSLHEQTVINLLHLIERLGSYSLTPRQTAAFLELLRQDSTSHQHMNKYFNEIMNCLSAMAHKDISERKPSYFFDFQDATSGITAPAIKRWGGTGFSVHVWVCLEFFPHKTMNRIRRQLYSFSNDHGVGMEAFFTSDCQLVLAVSTKKNYFTVKLNEYPFIDNKWHCIQIVHHHNRKVFTTSGLLQVYVDNVIQLSTYLRFPTLSNVFTLCHIGSSGHRTNASPTPSSLTLGSINENNSSNSDRVVVIDNGSQDEVWGRATSLLGQLGSVIVLNDVLKDTQLTSLYNAGPDMWKSNRSSDGPFEEIPSSKIVLYYEAKACFRHVCEDVSCNEPVRQGRLTGHKIFTWDIKDSINCIGGMSVLTPLVETIHLRFNTNAASVIRRKKYSRSHEEDQEMEVAVVNPLANFMSLLNNFITKSNRGLGWHSVNADMMVNCSIVSTLGALLQKMPVALLDSQLLQSIQLLVMSISTVQENSSMLLSDLYQYILFDFRIWCLTSPTTQYSHVQYLSTRIKENKKMFRSGYGVQYLLDVIKTYYCLTNNELTDDDARNIRCSLLGLIKFYIIDDVTSDEVTALLNFICAAKPSQEVQICEILDLLKSTWMCQCRDQLFSLLAESKFASYIYALLGRPESSEKVRKSICELLILFFKSTRLAEKHKYLLKHTAVGFHGILWQLQDFSISNKLASLLLDVVIQADGDGATYITLMGLCYRNDPRIRKSLCQHFLAQAYSKASFLANCTKQKAWQECITKLCIYEDDAVIATEDAKGSARRTSSETSSSADTLSSKITDDLTDDVIVNDDVRRASNDMSESRSSLSAPSSNSITRGRVRSLSSGSNTNSNKSTDYVLVEAKDARMEGDVTDLIVESIFLLMWRGVSGSSSAAWQERGQVFSCLNQVGSSYNLLRDLDEIKINILEHCAEAALSDVRESSATSGVVKSTGITFPIATENCAELVRLIHDMLTTDGLKKSSMWSEKLMENLFAVYDAMVVWELNSDFSHGNEWTELANIGLRLLCGCVDTEKLELVAMASAKLHNLIHSRPPSSTEEVCYLLSSLHVSVCKSINESSNVKEFVVPLIRDLLDKNFERLNMGRYLSELPPTTGSSRFFEEFLAYCVSTEWTSFIKTCVEPNAQHYERSSFEELRVVMTAFWTSTIEAFMVSYHTNARMKGESKLRFKANFESDFYHRRQNEEDRQNKNFKSLRNQNVSVLRQWRASKRFLASERGLWRERNPGKTYWKLSNVENFSRMRLKLTENYNFESHEDASRLRDNISLEEIKEKTQEALVPPSAVLTSSDASKEDDSVGDEDWSMLATNPNVTSDEQSAKEKIVLTEDCQLVTLMDVVSGKLEVTTTHVYFYDKTSSNEEGGDSGLDFKWSLSQLREVHFRRYNLRKSALELFLIDQTNYFINFQTNIRQRVYKALLSVKPPNLLYYGTRTPQELLRASGLTQKWIQREISNFDYLMQLNTIAGRTYNDLSQYPVFPWILKDYASEKLEIDNPDFYRDLSKPIGVLNPKNEKEVRERYEHFEDPNGVISKFHYGSHYSNAAIVLFYMLRMEPFTTLHIQLQAGRFDLSDRQFHSIAATWQTMMDTSNDVKELIPEFFYMPEFLENSNGFDLGKLQFSQDAVDNVILPKWAKSPADFIFQHRKALESDHVSSHLHHWIDLVFGHKQRGTEAMNAYNVFYYCTYEGAVDLNAITDPVHRKAVEGMINNFGQTPTQLLTEPHPKRMTRGEASKKILGSKIKSTLNVGDEKRPNVLEQPNELKAFFVEVMADGNPLVYVTVPRNQSHSFMQSGMPDSMVTVSERGVIGLHGWLPYDRSITNYFTFEKDPSVGNSRLQKSVKGLLSPGLRLSPHLFLLTHDAKFMVVGGYWDNSIRIMTVRGKTIACLARHLDVVTCLALDHGGTYLMSGSYDTTCIIWKLTQSGGVSNGINAQFLHILYGHEDVVTSVVINSELDVALSSSKDGTCIVHTVRKGHYVRTIRPIANNPQSYAIPSVVMSDEGRIVLYARSRKDAGQEKHFLHLYSINGQHLALDCLEARLGHMTICGEHLVTGDINGVLIVRELFSFHEISRLQLCRPITCVFVTKGMTHILACLRDGKLIIVGVDRPAKSRGLFTSTT
ncbi:neurobeachin-like protein 1 isoform X1 [Clavelina lepadiformis]|uniref:neurobeachin-like protein 1 isoform X1 n=1 Tax=Clavelina lepadiformis TaxID=159417 RepID=UPI004042A275